MKHRSPKLLYFSLDPSRISSFWKWVDDNGYKYGKNTMFREAEVPYPFIRTADLLLYLVEYEQNLQSLHVIIEYESIKDTEDKDIIRNIIVEFPEVQFLFDKQYARDLSISSFLFPDVEFQQYIRSYNDDKKKEELRTYWNSIEGNIDYSLVELHLRNPNDDIDPSVIFARIISGYDNTFDASNLRYAIKLRKYLHLKVTRRNFQKVQDSRFNNLAIIVEEESKQNIFNSYSLYVNGYRALPITTKYELEIVNSENFKFAKKGIIIRDFDLQFEDEEQGSIDKIRGYRYCKAEDFEEGSLFYTQYKKFIGEKSARRSFYLGWNDLTHIHVRNYVQNNYWNKLIDSGYPLYFITKGPKYSKIIHSIKGEKTNISKDNMMLYLSGLVKPVCGLYIPLQLFPEVCNTYEETRYSDSKSFYEIITSREGHDHSTPLDVYDIANRMIRRAEIYNNNKRYLLAALLAGEALEILNGFHHRLIIKAYFIQAIAENAVAMDVVGSNEQYLAKDAMFRVNKIKEDIDRFYYGYEEKSKWNILNHIFSTCRKFCKEHEHFESEAVFISAIGHLNEGYEIQDLFTEARTIWQKFKNEFVSFLRLIINWRGTKIDGK